MAKRKETEFDKLGRLIKEEGEDIRSEMGAMEKRLDGRIDGLRKEMHQEFATVHRRLNTIIQIQLDQHAGRIKKLETAVFSK